MANDKSWVWDHFEWGDQKAGNNKTHFQAWCNYCITNVIKKLCQEDKSAKSKGILDVLRTEAALRREGQ